MKKSVLVLLLLGLTTVWGMHAFAVDVKVSGEYYAGGMYLDKTTLAKNSYTYIYPTTTSPYYAVGTGNPGGSTAFYFQRLRLNTVFVVSPGLTLTTRADIMERAWGANRSTPVTALDTLSAGTRAENENIAFDLVYLTYVSPIGIFTAGYQIDGAWGTVFGDNSIPLGKVTYSFVKSGLVLGLQAGKINGGENSYTAINTTADGADKDNNFYTAFLRYSWKTGQAGLLFKWIDVRSYRNSLGFKSQYLATLPYAKAKFGPVDVQTEVVWLYGKGKKYEEGISTPDVDKNAFAFWLDATADFGMAYVGGTFAYLSGQDPSDTTKDTVSNGGLDWNPCLILFNSDLNYWAGTQPGYGANYVTGGLYGYNGGGMTNAWFFQVKGGVRPIDKLDIGASVSYANAVVKPTTAWMFNDYGWEVDLTATYKISNNLSYMLGGGYLFTGKFFKGSTDYDIQNDFLVLNKLTLTF